MVSGSRMIIVHGFVSYRVACRERAMQVFHEIAKTARSEPGCLRYDVFLAVSGGPTLFLLQEWENLDALTSHFRTEDMERLAQSLPEVIDGEINTRRFEIPDPEPTRRDTPRHVIH